jgi:tetratricopeptide (TPR) repeat protein/CHAT domain-containing protein
MHRLLYFVAFALIGLGRVVSADEPAADAERAARIAERDRLRKEALELRGQGKNTEAIECAQKMIAVQQELFGKDNRDLLAIWGFIAEIAEGTEDWTRAGEARAQAWRIAALAYGKSNWRTTDARLAREHVARLRGLSADDRGALREATKDNRDFARLFSAGKYDDAMQIATTVLNVRQRVLGPEHRETATSLNNLAAVYDRKGNNAEAESLYRQALKIYQKSLGEDHPDIVTSLNNLAVLYHRQGNYSAAEPLYKRALKICEKVKGPEHPETATGLNSLAVLYDQQRNYAAAEPLYQRALTIREKVLGPEHPDTVTSLNNLALLYKDQGNYAAAEPLYQRALTIREKVLGPEHPDTVTSLNKLALLYKDQDNYAAAEPLYQRALNIREKVLGPEHLDTATSLNNLALLYMDRGNYAAAEPLYQRALKIREKALGPEHPDTATSLNNLALLYLDQGNFAVAEPLLQRALKISEKALGPEHRDTAGSLNNLAGLYDRQGKYAAAEPLYQRALKIREKVLGPEHPDTAESLNNLALLYRGQGNYAAAEPLLQRALTIYEKVLGLEHPITATFLNNMAALYGSQGNYAAAEPLYQRALKISEKVLGPEHPGTVRSLSNLALLYRDQGDYAGAEPLLQRALEIREKSLGPEHLNTADSLNNLAAVYNNQGKYAAAEPLYQRALSISEKVLGPEHPDTALSLNNLASLYKNIQNYAAAEPLYQQALKICEKSLGEDHPDTANVLNNLGFLQWEVNGPMTALPLLTKGLGIQIRQLERASSVQSEQQQLLMAKAVSNHFNMWLSVTSADRASAEEAWRYVLAWKGLTTSRQLGLRQALRDDPTYVQYCDVGQRLSTLTLSPPSPPPDPMGLAAWREREPELRRQWEERKGNLELEWERLEKELSRKLGAFRQARDALRVSPAMVQALLSSASGTAALIDLVEYGYVGRAGERSEWRIAAFVVRGDRHVERIELGASEPIKQQVALWREGFGRGKGSDDPGPELRRMLWEPIATYLDGIDIVLISPDGVLAQLPWGALPGDKPGSYLIEERAVAVIPTPQLLPELLERERQTGPPKSLLLAGDIEYGADAGAPQHSLAQRSAAGRMRDGKLLSFGKLESAQAELASIERRYRKKVRDGESETLEGPGATEAAFRDQAGRHAWLHVITHGFFAPETIRSALRTIPADEKPRTGVAKQSDSEAPPAGIGAGLQVSEGRCLVTQLVDGGAAEKDGRLKVDDEILAVAAAEGEWTPVAGKPLSEIVVLIRGPAGSVVRLKVRPKADPDGEIEVAIKRAALPTAAAAKPVVVHPGLLSGLAFAGANSPPEEGKDDGILTALEVSALDLSKVDTVVLSACETGLGEVAGGEGLLGLQRAFQVAGAKTVVASLWKVPDRATSALMQRFYENLWDKKMGKLAALREAQIWMMRDKGNRGLALGDDASDPDAPLPPFYWAAFVLSGDRR